MSDEIKEAFKVAYFSFSFMGSLFALTFWPVADRKKACSNVLIGTVVSVISTPALYSLLLWKWPTLPQTEILLGAAYFWMGLMGMQIIPVVAFIINRLKNVKIVEKDDDVA